MVNLTTFANRAAKKPPQGQQRTTPANGTGVSLAGRHWKMMAAMRSPRLAAWAAGALKL